MSGITSISGGYGTHQVVTVYGNGSVSAGNGNDTIYVGGTGHVTVGGGHDFIGIGNGGVITQHGTSGRDTISLGNTHDTISTQGSATVTGPFGTLGLFGSATVNGGELQVGQNSDSTLKLTAVHGDVTITGGSVPTEMIAGSGTNLLKGGVGADTFIGGTGSSTLVGGSGQDVFEFLAKNAGGTDVIKNFVSGCDDLYLEGHSFSWLKNAGDITDKNGNTYIKLDGGKTTIELQGVTLKSWDVTTHKP